VELGEVGGGDRPGQLPELQGDSFYFALVAREGLGERGAEVADGPEARAFFAVTWPRILAVKRSAAFLVGKAFILR
jgi:hypothetical protein